MTDPVSQLLSQYGACFEHGYLTSFNHLPVTEQLQACTQGNVIVPLLNHHAVSVSGAEQESFLQNMFSNDIKLTADQQAQYSSMNSAKGRMLFNLLIWRESGNIILQTPAALSAALIKRLTLYKLRSQVEIAPCQQQFQIGVSGNLSDFSAALSIDFPVEPMQTTQTDSGITLIRLEQQRGIISCPADQLTALWPALTASAQPVSPVCWDWLNLQQGIPTLTPDTQEQFVPQMLNLDLIDGISFKKGCYPGQEVVARMKYLGKLKRRMYLAHLQTEQQPRPGDSLFDDESCSNSCGKVVLATPSPGGGTDLLAVLQISSQQKNSVYWSDTSQQPAALQFTALPYSIPESS